MLNTFINSVLIIDDKENEVKPLIKLFKSKDIDVAFLQYIPKKNYFSGFGNKKIKRNRNLIFLDLELDPYISGSAEIKIKNNISSIIQKKLFEKKIDKSFGLFGIILWTKHDEFVNLFKEKIITKSENNHTPLFVINLDKSKYLREGFNSVIDDLEEKLKNSIAANFYINWTNLINNGRINTIKSIFELITDYQRQDINLEFLLFKMAISNSGIPIEKVKEFPIYKEAYKAFTEMLAYDVTKNISDNIMLFNSPDKIKYVFDDNNLVFANKDRHLLNGTEYFSNVLKSEIDILKSKIRILKENGCDVSDIEEKKKEKSKLIKKIEKNDKETFQLLSKINTKLLLDDTISYSEPPSPGNIYEVKDKNSLLTSSKKNDKDKVIAIEMTPPCDFANLKNDKPKLLGGFITKYSKGRLRELKGDSFYTEIYPILLNNSDEISLMVFDFKKITIVNEDDLKNNRKFKLIYRSKDKLFADILQKMSAYTARLGLSIIR